MTADRLHAHVTAQTLAVLGQVDAGPVLAALRREIRAGRCEPTRRGFLATLAAATAGMTVDPERLVWTPSPIVTVAEPLPEILGRYEAKQVWIAHALANDIVTRLIENLRFTTHVNRADDDTFATERIHQPVRLPLRFIGGAK